MHVTENASTEHELKFRRRNPNTNKSKKLSEAN